MHFQVTEAVIENPNRSNDYISVSAVEDPDEDEDPNTLSTSTGCSTSPG